MAPNIPTFTDRVTVTVGVAVDVWYASSNDDVTSIGISNGKYFIGIKVDGKINLPCHIEDGDSMRSTPILKYFLEIAGHNDAPVK